MDCVVYAEHWSEVVSVATHFNEMLMSTRSLVAGITPAIFGAAAISLVNLKPQHAFFLKLHVGVWIVLVGLVVLFVMFLIDYCYYYQLLLGAVDVAKGLEDACHALPQLTNELIDRMPKTKANVFIFVLYGTIGVLLIGLAIMIQNLARKLQGDT